MVGVGEPGACGLLGVIWPPADANSRRHPRVFLLAEAAETIGGVKRDAAEPRRDGSLQKTSGSTMRVTEDESAKRLAVGSYQDDVLAVARALAAACAASAP